ncbi:hypothetical protein SLA2020_291770 [Shorea laevis]
MSKEAASSVGLEWRINVPDGTSEVLKPTECRPLLIKIWLWLKSLLGGLIVVVWRFLETAWSIAAAEPRKVVHGLKLGLAISIVSLLYYIGPLSKGFGSNASLWAVMTVVVIYESNVGATLYKCVNRTTGTFLAGGLGLGVHWVAHHAGEKAEPVILGISVFLFASAATFSRFMPLVKARFDYGAMIFVLTFSLISVSGYREEQLLKLARSRLSSIAAGVSICILIIVLICPIWAGGELHRLIHQNMEKLADSLDACVAEYFKENGKTTDSKEDQDYKKKMQGYKCVLNSKAAEESLANSARWEPTHGRFNFGHPWTQYLKISASMRNCACCIETLTSCLSSEIQAPACIRNCLSDVSMRLCSHTTSVLKELATTIKTMTKSSTIDILVAEMNFAVQELQNALNSLPSQFIPPELMTVEGSADAKGECATKSGMPPLLEVLPLVTAVSLLIEIAARIGGVVDAVEELASLAEFKPARDYKKPQQDKTKP